MIRGFILSLAFVSSAAAGVQDAVDQHVLPGMAEFGATSEKLAETARADCAAEALKPGYQAAFDDWLGIGHLRFGPLEENGRALAIAFWPDPRGFVQSTVARLIADADPVVEDPEAFAEVSVAGRGLFALERLLYDPDIANYQAGSYECRAVRAITADLARMAAALEHEWRDDYAGRLLGAGEKDNAAYLSEREAAQALYTALITGLAFNAEQRIGRPLGTFERPRPERAEARRSGRPLRNVILSLEGLRELARTLAEGDVPETMAAFDLALEAARGYGDRVFANITDPTERLRLEIVQQRIEAVMRAVEAEIGTALGVSAGFNATDGD